MSDSALVLVFFATTALSSLLFLREFILRRKNTKLTDSLLEEAQKKSYQLLHQAMKKSQAILGMAELESIKTVSDSKHNVSGMEEQYIENLAKIIGSNQQRLNETTLHLEKAMIASENQFSSFLNELRTHTSQIETTSQQVATQRINQLFEHFETKIADFLVQTEQKTLQSIELELKSARQLIDGYKTRQLELVDENVIAMLERTLSLVLAKKLSLKDQMDLVYESLERAKIEKFVI